MKRLAFLVALVAASLVLACEQEVVVGPNDVPPALVAVSWRFVGATAADPEAVVFTGDSTLASWAGDTVALRLGGAASVATPPPRVDTVIVADTVLVERVDTVTVTRTDTVTVEVPARHALLVRILERLIKEGNDSLLAERVLEFPAELASDSTLEFEAPWVVDLPRFQPPGGGE